MPTPTYTPLANITLGSNTTSVTFSSITSGFRDYIIVFDGAMSAGNTNLGIRFNGDTASNYSNELMYGAGSGGGTAAAGTTNFFTLGYVTTTDRITGTAHILDATTTDKHKSGLNRYGQPSGTGNPLVAAVANRWANTAAITSITVLALTNAMATGSTIALYGIAA
jgi:hypothetical protein